MDRAVQALTRRVLSQALTPSYLLELLVECVLFFRVVHPTHFSDRVLQESPFDFVIIG